MGTASWPATQGSGGLAPQDSLYSFVSTGSGQKRVLAKTQPLYGGAFKCNFLRAPSAPQQFFASEQIVDELAHAANMDPVAFRRQNVDGTTTTGARWLAVLDGATLAAGWKPKVANSVAQTGTVRHGRGFGFGIFANSQVGIVADVEVNVKTGKMVAKHLYVAQNNGITVGPQLVANQMSGAMIQGLSRAMLEQTQFTKERITSTDWVTYPILRFADAPHVTLVNVHPGEYMTVNPDFSAGAAKIDVSKGNANAFDNGWLLTGSGEPPTAAIAGAMANAFFDATGARVRQSPMNTVNCRNALKQAGIA
jgi:nicotinate dehydrogenase subunit B